MMKTICILALFAGLGLLSACSPYLPVTGGAAPVPTLVSTAAIPTSQPATLAPTATSLPPTATLAPTMSMPTPSTKVTKAPSVQQNDGAQHIAIAGFAFSPSTLTVPVGTKVRWTNNDSTQHTVTADSGTFDSGPLDPGKTFAVDFSQPGTYTYHCNFHPGMVGKIVVTGAGASNSGSGSNGGSSGGSMGGSGGYGGGSSGSNGGSGGMGGYYH